MTIRLNLHPNIGEGDSAHVFKVDDKAYKLFRRRSHRSDEKCRSTFQSQCEAYRRASSDPDLKKYIATFYGTCVIEDVFDQEGLSIRGDYMLDCCYVLETLHGCNAKVLAVWDSLTLKGCSHVGEAYCVFKQKGFDLADADVFNFGNPKLFKFVDFCLKDWPMG